jgi:D-glycero-D-manno-heptose 1,7-bisphosphate phosphatase
MKLIILDRDGTINEDRDDFIKSADEWVPMAGALEAIARLNHAGWHIVIALLAAQGGKIDGVFYCPHTPDDACLCRKPLPGLFEQIIERYGIDMTTGAQTVHTVGDSLRDLQAGVAAGCLPHLVLTGKGAKYYAKPADLPEGTRVHTDLAAFAEHVLSLAA